MMMRMMMMMMMIDIDDGGGDGGGSSDDENDDANADYDNVSGTFEVFLVYFFVCLDFLKRILIPNIFIHNIFKLRRHLGTKTRVRKVSMAIL